MAVKGQNRFCLILPAVLRKRTRSTVLQSPNRLYRVHYAAVLGAMRVGDGVGWGGKDVSLRRMRRMTSTGVKESGLFHWPECLRKPDVLYVLTSLQYPESLP